MEKNYLVDSWFYEHTFYHRLFAESVAKLQEI